MTTQPVVLNGTFTSENGSVVGVFNGTMTTGEKPPTGGPPPGIWPGPGDPDFPAGLPHPEHPIVLPKPPTEGPPDIPPTNPPDPQWVWGWTWRGGGVWVPVYVPGEGEAGPKA